MSLLHLSISASEPQRVAAFLATVLGGNALPFPPFPDCWIAFTKSDDGTAIEVYPTTHTLNAGPERIACEIGKADTSNTFIHAAIASPLDREKILKCASDENWLARICDRGPFQCVEIWLEDRILMEILDPIMQEDYRSGMTIENWTRMFGLDRAV